MLPCGQKSDSNDVTAIVTAMTDGEQFFLYDSVEAVLSDAGISQAVLCIEENNAWVDRVLGSLTADSRLEIVRMPLAPLGAVRNRALDHVQTPWVAYCDGDDVWCKGKTFIQRTFANTTKCDFVGCDHYLTDEHGRIKAIAFAKYIPMPSSWMVRTQIMKLYPFSELMSMSVNSDGEWWRRTEGTICKVRCPRLLIRYRVRQDSLSSSEPSKRRKAKAVAVASIPVLGKSILFLTWCIWLLGRRKRYIRLND
jgi:glycosyltransferase involved in cell wall biosynthesis